MADVNLFQKKSMAPAEVDLNVSVALDAANDPTVLEANDLVSVAHTGVGQYTFTFRHKWMAAKAVVPALQAAAAVDLVPQVRSVDVSGAKTVVVELLAAAVATDPPAKGANATVLHLRMSLRNSSVKGS